MANRLLEMLTAQYRERFGQFEALCDRLAIEGRSGPGPSERAEYDSLRDELDELGPRIVELREQQQRRTSMSQFMAEVPMPADTGLVYVRSEEAIYRRADASGLERVSFFRDLLHSQEGDPESRSRLDRHQLMTRAAGTTGTGAGVVPPTWLYEEFAGIAHGTRPWADTLRRIGITDANPVNIGVAQPPGAAVTVQASENAPPSDGSFNAVLLTTSPKTLTGKTDVSRQLVDGSNPAVDSIIYADLMGSYNEQVETLVVNAFEAATGFAATITFPGTAPVYANLFDAFIDGSASVAKHRKAPPKVVFCSQGAWAYMSKEKDSQNRPLIVTGYHGPMNAMGIGEAAVYGQIAGEAVGLQIIPSWAAVDNHLYVAKADDLLLLESSTFNFRYEEVLGPESIRLGVWGYAAPVLARYPAAIAKVDAGTTIPAPAEADTPPAVGSGGEGSGAPRAHSR
jgi:HK97 family phage major capsid protein